MRSHFAEVLARESVCLAGVTDRVTLVSWRHDMVEELTTRQSPYRLALRQTGEVHDRADFVDTWRDLIAQMAHRMLQSGAGGETISAQTHEMRVDVDAQRTAVLILAALHGGSILSELARDPQPLNAALDLALAPLMAGTDDTSVAATAINGPVSNMET